MSRTATLAFSLALLVALSNPALAQMGMRTAEAEPEVPETAAESEEDCITNGFLPLWPKSGEEGLSAKTRCFWEQEGQEYLKYGRFVTSSKTVSATTEILSDAFGAVRLSLSTAVAANTDDDDDDGEVAKNGDEDEPTPEQDETLNLLTANGGNLALTASYPLYYWDFAGGGGKFLWNSYLRAATNVAALGSTGESTQDWEDVNGNVELAFTELQLDLLSSQQNFNLLGYLKTSAIFGTDEFAKTLHEDASKSFFHAQVGAGMRLGKILMIHATYNWYSDGDIPGEGGTLTFTMVKAK